MINFFSVFGLFIFAGAGIVISADKVLVLIAGKLVKVGDYKLAEKIEKEGYDKIGSKSQVSSNK